MIHVCSLAALPDTVKSTGASHVLTIMARVDQVQRPQSVLEANHLKVQVDDITEPMDGFIAPSDMHVEQVLNFGVDGVLIDLPRSAVPGSPETRCPVVLLDDPDSPKGTSSVYFDLQRGARDLATHLAGLGHRTIVYVDSPRQVPTFQDRRRFLTEQLKRIAPEDARLIEEFVAGARAMRHAVGARSRSPI